MSVRSSHGDDRAESLAVGAAAVQWKEVVLLRADADVVDRPGTGVLELGTVGGGEVEQGLVAGARDESRVALRREVLPDLIPPAADARPDARPDVVASVLVLHEGHSGPGHAGARAAPA